MHKICRHARPTGRLGVVVTADEMPNFPHLDLDKAGKYALAKIKETIIAVTGP